MSPFSDAERQSVYRAGVRSDLKQIKQAVIGQQNRRAASDLVKIAAAKVRACALGEYDGESAAQMFPGDQFVQRALSTPATMANTPDVLGFSMADSLVGLAPPGAAFVGLINHGTQVDLAGIAKIYMPKVVLSAADAGNWPAEGVSSPARVLSFTVGSSMEPRKLVVNTVFTREAAEHTSITTIMRRVLGEASTLAIETAIFSNSSASPSKPAGILQTSAIGATANGGITALAEDVSNMLAALVTAGGGGDPIFFAHPATAARLRALWLQFPYPLYTSGAISADLLICSEGAGFVSGFVNGGLPEIRVSTETTIVTMDDDPTADISVGGTLADSVRSLWQGDLVSMKMTVRCGWCTRAAALVQQVSSVSW
jgi:hypothetical protein